MPTCIQHNARLGRPPNETNRHFAKRPVQTQPVYAYHVLMLDYRIISIGTLSYHELWGVSQQQRTAHATTTLIQSGDVNILVDPGLPGQAVTARLTERAGLTPDDIHIVFLTSFRPAHRRGLTAFAKSKWFIAEMERETVGRRLVEDFQQQDHDAETQDLYRQEIAVLKQCETAPDTLAEHVDLFPMYGYSPGTCGLLLSYPRRTVLLTGDAAPTAEHVRQGRVLRGAFDVEQAQESLKEAIEIADVIVPGHDNVLLNPTR